MKHNKYLLLLLVLFNFYKCGRVDCNKSVDYYRGIDVNFIIIEKLPLNHGREINLKVKKIIYDKFEDYCEENTWFAWNYINFEKGDTIVKHKGELTFYIHKKDTVMKFPFECDGKIYK